MDAKISSSKDIWMMLASMEPKKSQTSSEEATATDSDAKSNNAPAQEEKDTFSLIVGSKGAGKTSLTACFRNSAKGARLAYSPYKWRDIS